MSYTRKIIAGLGLQQEFDERPLREIADAGLIEYDVRYCVRPDDDLFDGHGVVARVYATPLGRLLTKGNSDEVSATNEIREAMFRLCQQRPISSGRYWLKISDAGDEE